MSALQGMCVVELATSVAGEFCAKLLADFGARVIKVEPPHGGSPTRAMAPLRETTEGPCSGLFAWLNTNKNSVALDTTVPADREALHALLAGADVVVDDHDLQWLARTGLAPAMMEARYPTAVFCSISPRGLAAAPEHWRDTSLNIYHDSGWGYHTPTAADPGRPPLKGPGRFLPDYEAGLEAASCILAALHWRRASGLGQHIDIAKRNVLVSRADLVLGRILAGDDAASDARTAYDQAGPSAFFPCADGAVYLYMTNQKHWRGVQELMDNPAWMADYDGDWLEFGVTQQLVARFQQGFREWVADKPRTEVSDQAQRLGVPLVPVNNAADLYQSPQFQFRGFFQALTDPRLGELALPTVPIRLDATPAALTAPAPVLGGQQGISLPPRDGDSPAQPGAGDARRGPLAGLRVLEITKVWAGPYAGKLLAFLGAEVIKVESHTNMDELRAFGGTDIDHAPFFLSVNQEIKSIQANMKTGEGMDLVRQLIAHSDIVINNLRPGAMERLGLGHDELKKIKPDIITVSIKMFGNDGPLGHQTGYAPSFSALGGLSHLVGYEGEQPMGINMRYGDSTVGAWSVLGALVALAHRERTGEGQFVDVSAVECMAAMAGDSLVHYALTGENPGPDGNRHPDMAPHGVYPCSDGGWLCIACGDDGQWRALCDALGEPQLADDPLYRTPTVRQENLASLDTRVAALTRGHECEPLARQLRQAGIAASKSLSSLDLIGDETLWHSGAFRQVSDEANGTRPVIGPGWRMSRTDLPISRGAPRLGEHNREIYGKLLGLSEAEIAELMAQKIIY